MEFNALPPQLRQQNGFSIQPQQGFQQQQQAGNGTSHLMYQSDSFSTPQSQGQQQQPMSQTAVQTQQPIQWAMGNNLAKGLSLQRRNHLEMGGRPRPISMTASSIRHLGMQMPRLQTEFIQQPTPLDTGVQAWAQKNFSDNDFQILDQDMTDLGQGLMSADENAPIIDLRQLGNFDLDSNHDASHSDIDSRRMSESTYSMTSNGPLAEVSSVEDLSSSEMYTSDCDWSGVEAAAPNFSPTASPKPLQQELIRSGSRSRASPVPHNNMRTSPYTLESNRNKRWSTGMYAPMQATPPRPVYHSNRYSSIYGSSPLNPHHGLNSFVSDNGVTTFAAPGQSLLYSQNRAAFHNGHPALFSSPDGYPEPPRQLPSQSIFRHLPSHGDRMHGCSGHFGDLSDPPDLYSSLHEEPSNPPESDMNPEDPDMIPHEQDLRFPGDLYTPRWVRGHGNKREGWCGLCKPGRWLVLKNSAFWYDKSFTHGVSAATGAAFQAPTITRRTEGNSDVWEGLCGGCGDWVSLVSSKKKGTTWFRHAYKCHTHPKVKDGPKRRREPSTNIRARAASISSASFPLSNNTSEDVINHTEIHHTTEPLTRVESSSDTPTASTTNILKESIKQHVEPEKKFPLVSDEKSEQVIEQMVEPSIEDTDDPEPLTATRISMDFDVLIKSDEYLKPKLEDMKPEFRPVDYKAKNSSDSTPLSTPQLSHTTMSTPQIETPQVMPLGLGVHGLGMGYDHDTQAMHQSHHDFHDQPSHIDPLSSHAEHNTCSGEFQQLPNAGLHSQDLQSHPFHDFDEEFTNESHTMAELEMQRHHDDIINSMNNMGSGISNVDGGLVGFGGSSSLGTFAGMI